MRIQIAQAEVRLPHTDKPLFTLPKLEIESGEKILITGESGRGKTTLLHLLAGLFTSDKGSVRVGDVNLNEMNDEERCAFRSANIALVFQKLNLLEHLTAAENVGLGRNVGADETAKALASVGLTELAARRVSLLSLGEQQRVAVARVLATKARLILADEPTSSLDGRNAEAVIGHLFRASEGQTLVVVSHDERLLSRFDRRLEFDKLVKR